MRTSKTLTIVIAIVTACLIHGCGPGPQVDQAVNKIKPNLSPAHKALLEERKKEDGP